MRIKMYRMTDKSVNEEIQIGNLINLIYLPNLRNKHVNKQPRSNVCTLDLSSFSFSIFIFHQHFVLQYSLTPVCLFYYSLISFLLLVVLKQRRTYFSSIENRDYSIVHEGVRKSVSTKQTNIISIDGNGTS